MEVLTLAECGLSPGAAETLADAFGGTLKRLTVTLVKPDTPPGRVLSARFGDRVSFGG